MIRAIFTDIGGVLLTNGWDHDGRNQAIERFGLDKAEFSQRHEMVFGTYEEGRMTIEDYLAFVVFYCPRSFSKAEFITFMKELSQPISEGIIEDLLAVKRKYNLPVFATSNEGRELAEYRIKTFKLNELIDAFIVSGFVAMRKPALGFYSLAIDLAQVQPEQALYIDDRAALIDAGGRAGLVTLHHVDRSTTAKELARHNLAV